MTFSESNKEKHLRRIKSTVTQSQVEESNDGHPLGKMLSGKMLAPSPAFQKALLGFYLTQNITQHMICCISASLHSPVADFIVRNPDSGEYPRRTTLMLVTEYLCWDLCRECSKMGMLVTKTTKTIIYIPKSQIVTNISNFLLTVFISEERHKDFWQRFLPLLWNQQHIW